MEDLPSREDRVVRIADAAGNEADGAPVTVFSPNGGNIWRQGTRQVIRWNYTGNPGPQVKIELLRGWTFNRLITAGTTSGAGGTGLLYLSNTESNVFLDTTSQFYYALLSGRWFATKSLKDGRGHREDELHQVDAALIASCQFFYF